MIHFRCEPLLPARVTRLGESSTNVSGHDSTLLAEVSHCPFQIGYGKPSVFPVRHRFRGYQAIEVDRYINIAALYRRHKILETISPGRPQNGPLSILIAYRPVIGPRMHFQTT